MLAKTMETALAATKLVQGMHQELAEVRAASDACCSKLTAAVAGLDDRVTKLEQRITVLEASGGGGPVSVGAPGDATPIELIATSAGEQLHEARTRLLGTRTGLRLANVEVAVRGEAAPTSDERVGLRLGKTAAELGENVSELSLSYAVDAHDAAAGRGPTTTAPELIGYTLAPAQRKAAAAGLELEVSRQTVLDRSRVGVVVAQTPEGGVQVQTGSRVRVFVGV